MPFCLSAILRLAVNLVECPFPAQREEPVLCHPLFERLKPIARVIGIPKEFGIFKSFVNIHTLVPLRLVRFPAVVECSIVAIPPLEISANISRRSVPKAEGYLSTYQ